MNNRITTSNFFASIFSSFILSVINIVYALSLAAFIFSGELSKHLHLGLMILLIGTAIPGFIIALKGSIPGGISTPKGNLCAVIALMAISISAVSTNQQVLPTLIFAIIISTVLTGLVLLLIGVFKAANYFRFIPYPVIGGYFAGIGFILVSGSVSVMTNLSLSIDNLKILIQPVNLTVIGFGLLFAVVLVVLDKKIKHFLVIPLLLIVSIIIFYAVIYFLGISISKAKELGLLFHDFSLKNLSLPINMDFFKNINFISISKQIGNIFTIIFLSTITMLLSCTSLEIGIKKDIDLNKDFKVTGYSNIITGLFGGVVGFYSPIDTILGYKIGAKTRFSGIFYAIICGGIIFIGPSIISYMPKSIIGGLVLYQGIDLLITWIYKSQFKLPKLEYSMIIIILLVVIFVGFIQGVGVGIIIAAILFLVNYSRIDVVKHKLDGTKLTSKVIRPQEQKKILSKQGKATLIFTLQGYIFFGTSDRIFNRIKNDLKTGSINFIILDFREVNNIDSSAVNSFIKMKQFVISEKIILILANFNKAIDKQFEIIKYFDNDYCKMFKDRDFALEWCEDEILKKANALNIKKSPIDNLLIEWFGNTKSISDFKNYLSIVEVDTNKMLFKEGDRSDSLYFIEYGKITIFLELNENTKLRLATMNEKTVIGEMGIYTKNKRSASAIAEEKTKLYMLTSDSLEKMQAENPTIAAQFHRYIIKLLSERIAKSNDTIREIL